MKNCNFFFFVLIITTFSITNSNAQIISHPDGGAWHMDTTWVNGVVPNSSTAVVINGPVTVASNVECASITINSSLKNYNSSNYALTVSGNVTNHGIIANNTIGNFYLSIGGDIENNGIWSNQTTYMNGTSKQSIHLQSGESFNCNFQIINTSDTIKAMTELSFTGFFDLSSGVLNLDNHNIRFTGSNTYFGRGTILSPNQFLGTVNIYQNTNIEGDLTIIDTLQNRSGISSNVYINGNVVNNGIIQKNISGNFNLSTSGDITNNGIWKNNSITLNGNIQQKIYLQSSKVFNCNFYFSNSADTIKAMTDLSLTGFLDLSSSILDLDNHNIRFTGSNTYFGHGTILSPNQFLGTVNIYSNTNIEGDLIIMDTLQNKSGISSNVYINGNVVNNGIIQKNISGNFNLLTSGDVTNNGIWKNNSITLNGNIQQKIYLQSGKVFNCNFYVSNSADTIKAMTDLLLTGSFDISNKILDLDNHNIRFIGSNTYFGHGTILSPNQFLGTVNIYSNTNIEGDLIIMDTLQNRSGISSNLYINGNIENNGLIQNNTSGNLSLHISGDIENNANWQNEVTFLNGITKQNIYLQAGKVFNCNFYNYNSSDTIKAITDLSLTGNFDISNNVLDLNNYNIRFTGSNTYFGHGTILSPNQFLGTVSIYSNTNIEGDLIVMDTLQNRLYLSSTLNIHGSIENNGLIQNNTSGNFSLNIDGNVENDGIWENIYTYLVGTNNQTVTLINDKAITSGIKFYGNFGNSPFQWYYNGNILDSPDFIGENSNNLSWEVPITPSWYGTFYCQTATGNSRNIIVEGFEEDSYALDFDGIDDFVKTGGISFPTGDLTIEAWIHPNVLSGVQEVVFFYDEVNGVQFRTHDNGSFLYGESVNGNWNYVISPANSIEINKWTHIAITKQGDNCNLYVNGMQAGYYQFDNNPSPDTLSIGGRSKYMDRFFEGMIDEVRIWNIARSQSEIQDNLTNYLSGNETGLYAYYRNNEGVGQTAYNLSGNGLHAQLGLSSTNDSSDPIWTPTNWAYEVSFRLNLKAFLEGAINDTIMNTSLKPCLPLAQPYNTSPWNYTGTEHFTGTFDTTDIVDWVLVEFRNASDAANANSGTIINRKAGLLLKDGSIVDESGIKKLSFTTKINQNLFVVIHHRNHLKIMASTALSQSAAIYTYDFTSGISQAYLDGQKLINGKATLISGDVNSDGTINNDDQLLWKTKAGNNGYEKADINMNQQVDNQDKNNFWIINNGVSTVVPD